MRVSGPRHGEARREGAVDVGSRRRRRLAWLGGCVGWVGVGAMSCGKAFLEPWPEPPAFEAPAEYRYTLVPDSLEIDDPVAQASLLERRLAAFAAHVEKQRRRRLPPPVSLDREGLTRELESIVARLEGDATVAVHVRDLLGNRVVYDHYGDALMNPASNQKIVTAAAALDLLGADYVFETEFSYRDGALHVRGEGDPTLDSDALEEAVRGALEVIGDDPVQRIVVDDAAFSTERLAPGFDPGGVGVSYQAPSGALSLNFNTVEVLVYPVAGARSPAVSLIPASTHLRLDNRARVGSKDALDIRSRLVGEGDSAYTEVQVRGTAKAGARATLERRRIGDPGLFTGGAVAEIVAKIVGGEPPPVVRGPVRHDAELVYVHESPPLVEVADRGLAYSNNFIAEQMLRTMGWRLSGDPGDWTNGREVLEGYWTAIGNDLAAISVQNGSGMTREGRVSAASLVDLIAVAERNESHALFDALPVAGEEGTLRARLRKSGKRVRAKTGTMDGVSGLSGVILGEDGQAQIAFSILTNVEAESRVPASRRREVEDALVMTLLEHLDDWEIRWAIEILEAEPVIGDVQAALDGAVDAVDEATLSRG